MCKISVIISIIFTLFNFINTHKMLYLFTILSLFFIALLCIINYLIYQDLITALDKEKNLNTFLCNKYKFSWIIIIINLIAIIIIAFYNCFVLSILLIHS